MPMTRYTFANVVLARADEYEGYGSVFPGIAPTHLDGYDTTSRQLGWHRLIIPPTDFAALADACAGAWGWAL